MISNYMSMSKNAFDLTFIFFIVKPKSQSPHPKVPFEPMSNHFGTTGMNQCKSGLDPIDCKSSFFL